MAAVTSECLNQCHRAVKDVGKPYRVPSRARLSKPPYSPPSFPPESRKRPCSSSVSSKLEKCRTQAQQRRMTQKGLMDELASLLPFPEEVTSQMDTKTVLRLVLCYLRLKSLLSEREQSRSPSADCAVAALESSCKPHPPAALTPAAARDEGRRKDDRVMIGGGVLQDLMVEALQGFLMVMSCDGIILYLSESFVTYTGLFQSEHTGSSLYDLVHEEDHREVREALTAAEAVATTSGVAPCSFFCRMKSRKKNSHLVAPGYKLVYISGHCKLHLLEPYLACTVHVVSAPSILEIRVEGNAFTTRHSLDMKITFYDGRLADVLGYSKKDLIGQSLFSLHHHDDLAVTEKCSHKVREKGEAVTGYYRLLTHYGHYVWLQTRGTLMIDRRTGKPFQLVCMHFIVEKSKGDESLTLRSMLTDRSTKPAAISMDPVPVPRWDGESVNPLSPIEPMPHPKQHSTSTLILATPSNVPAATIFPLPTAVPPPPHSVPTTNHFSPPSVPPVMTQFSPPDGPSLTNFSPPFEPAMTHVSPPNVTHFFPPGAPAATLFSPLGSVSSVTHFPPPSAPAMTHFPSTSSSGGDSHTGTSRGPGFGQHPSPPLQVPDASVNGVSAAFAGEQTAMNLTRADLGEHYSTQPQVWDSCELLSSAVSQLSYSPLIKLPSPSVPCSQSLTSSPPLISSEREQCLYPPPNPSLSRSSSTSSISASGALTPFSDHPTPPVFSPYRPPVESSNPFPSSHSSSPHSIPGSANTISPHSNPTLDSEQAALDEILLDLLGNKSSHDDCSISPDSGYTELEDYLTSLASVSPPSITCTPAPSPADSSAPPTSAPSPLQCSMTCNATPDGLPLSGHCTSKNSRNGTPLIRSLLSSPSL